jgi:hypothetical protein
VLWLFYSRFHFQIAASNRTSRSSSYKAKNFLQDKLKKYMVEKVQNVTHRDTTKLFYKKRPVHDLNRSFYIGKTLNLIVMKCFFFIKKIKIPTPVEIAISAMLKIALKK